MSRQTFREQCVDRDGGECLVPWCSEEVTTEPDGPGEIHHIIERELWDTGGYIPENGACVCNEHHRMAEQNEIPPQAFWKWSGITIPAMPNECNTDGYGAYTWPVEDRDNTDPIAFNKWGERFDTPPNANLREYHKYPSTRHLLPLYWQSERGTAEQRTGRDDTGHTDVESFLDIPLVATVKLDGSNAMLVKDSEEPVRARNGRDANHESFDYLKQEYWDRNVYDKLPSHLQVFGENMYAKHSIHYGCEGCCDERNQGPALDDVFYVFGVYDTRYDLWLSWPETEQVAVDIGFPVAPIRRRTHEDTNIPFSDERKFTMHHVDLGEWVVDNGHEGIIVRTKYPFHYGQFERKLGKYVRPNHVQTDEHWSHQPTTRNKIDS